MRLAKKCCFIRWEMSATMAYNGYTNIYPLAVSHLEPGIPSYKKRWIFSETCWYADISTFSWYSKQQISKDKDHQDGRTSPSPCLIKRDVWPLWPRIVLREGRKAEGKELCLKENEYLPLVVEMQNPCLSWTKSSSKIVILHVFSASNLECRVFHGVKFRIPSHFKTFPLV